MARLNFGEEGGDFLECEPRFSNGPSQIMVQRLHRSLPQAAEVRRRREVEVPSDAIVRQPLDDPTDFTAGCPEEHPELRVGSHKVRPAGIIHRLAYPSAEDKAAEGGKECIDGVMTHGFEVNDPGAETDENRQKKRFVRFMAAALGRPEPDRTSEIYPRVQERPA
ncbi:hypothetical protein RF55_8338 [Lasius niger]|uniref:Uncharacterized protein n=1 Tax=Lasius niger TaxID=67767 RepID=A0A0J7KMY6_LASNI|nr:hypothetical protein RF55_8338 [Lasius niger]